MTINPIPHPITVFLKTILVSNHNYLFVTNRVEILTVGLRNKTIYNDNQTLEYFDISYPIISSFYYCKFLSLSIYPIKATNSLTTFHGPLYTNSQMEFASNTSNSSQSKLVNDSSLVTYNDTIKNLISTEK